MRTLASKPDITNILSGLILAFLGSACAASSNITSELNACSGIENAFERLKCFDQLSASQKPGVATSEDKKAKSVDNAHGDWVIRESLNPIDDSPTVTAYLYAHNTSSTYARKIYLVLRCKSRKPEAFINWGDYLGDSALVTDRIDKDRAMTKAWSVSTDSQAAFHPSAYEFINVIRNASDYVAQVTPYNESQKTALFDMRGAGEAVRSVLSECYL